MRGLFFPVLLAAAAACGCGARSDKAVAQFNLTSSAFQNGGAIPTQFTCDGAGQSPPLAWDEPPPGTKSFALIVDDPDAPSGTFHHWGAYDIPAATRSIAAGQSVGVQAVNDSGNAGYKGPCPPPGHGPHHYRFKLYALDVDRLGLATGPKIPDVEKAAQQHLVGRAELTGTYERR
jgi:Raf kinase inhibitor-like YbhB/YbcL family protein